MSQQIDKLERALELVQGLEAYNHFQQEDINEIETIFDDLIYDLERKEFFPLLQPLCPTCMRQGLPDQGDL